MISDKELAKQILDRLLGVAEELNETVRLAMDRCPREEFVLYRRAVGRVMGGELFDLLHALWATHPDLRPAELEVGGKPGSESL
jgi:hypothetical protein